MTNSKVIELYNALTSITGLTGVRFNYGLVKNINTLKSEIENLQKAVENSVEYQKFDTERIELCKEYAQKDEDGNPILENSSYVIEHKDKFNQAFKELKEKYAIAITSREAQLKEFDDLLKKESDVTLFKIKESEIPNEITTEQMKAVIDLVEN